MILDYVYAQLEQSIETCHKDPKIQPLLSYFSKLKRADAFRDDLAFYLGSDWATTSHPTSAVETYVKHLKQLEAKVCTPPSPSGTILL